jgi:hypothetical protein
MSSAGLYCHGASVQVKPRSPSTGLGNSDACVHGRLQYMCKYACSAAPAIAWHAILQNLRRPTDGPVTDAHIARTRADHVICNSEGWVGPLTYPSKKSEVTQKRNIRTHTFSRDCQGDSRPISGWDPTVRQLTKYWSGPPCRMPNPDLRQTGW